MEDAPRNAHYERMNALVDQGWHGILTPTELRVWLVYHRRADDRGVSYPKLRTIRKAQGIVRADHLRRARASLVDRGLLAPVEGRPHHFCICIPPTRGRRPSTTSRTPLPTVGDQQLVIELPDSGDQFLVKDSPKCAPRKARILVAHKDEQHREQPIEGKSSASPLRVAAAAGGGTAEPTLPGVGVAIAESLDAHRPEAESAGKRPRKLTDEQVGKWKAFMEWYTAAWPRTHDYDDYPWQGNRDAPAALKFLKLQQIDWDLDWAKQVALFYLAWPDGFREHLLPPLAARGNGFSRKLKQQHQEGNRHVITLAKPSAEQRGQFPEPERQRPPEFGRPRHAAG